MPDVVPLEVVPIDREGPDADVVALLRDLLERAERGEVRSVAVACVLRDERFWSRWAMEHRGSHALAGSVGCLFHAYMEWVLE